MDSKPQEEPVTPPPASSSFLDGVIGTLDEIVSSPLNLILLGISFYLIFKIVQDRRKKDEVRPTRPPPLPKLPKRDYTVQELLPFNGMGPEGRILIAINGKVFDVTRGRTFYGPGGPYEVFGGRDASRGLGTFALDANAIKETYDDLSDLTIDQMNTVKDWEAQFQDKYDLVGRLLRPGEIATDYALEEEEEANKSSPASPVAKKLN